MSELAPKLRAIMAIDPDRTEIEFAGRDYSWGTLAHMAGAIEEALDALAMPDACRIGVILRNRPAHVAAVIAVLASERCLVTLNPMLPDDLFGSDVVDLGLPVIIAEREDVERAGVGAAARAAGANLIILDPELAGVTIERSLTDPITPTLFPGVAIEMLTSGTTGKPKRVPMRRAALDVSFAGVAAYERGRDYADAPRLRSGVSMIANPLTHIGGIYGCIGALMAGRRIALLEKFSVDGWIDIVRRHQLKVASAVPSAVRMLLDAKLPREDLASLTAIVSGTAPLPPELVDAFLERYGIPILSNYGATEFVGAVAGWDIQTFRACWQEKRGAAGRVHADVAARIVDADSDAVLPPGEEGLLELQGAQLGTDFPVGGAAWLRTTDRAVLDADQFLFIRGRADNAIIRGGFKIHPDTIVDALHQHPAVREAAVIGVDDPRLGAVPAAAIILKAGHQPPTLDAFREWLKPRLIAYQLPVYIRFVDEIPRTPSLKPSAVGLKALFHSDIGSVEYEN